MPIRMLPLDNALWLSPMESVTDLAFRTLCHREGAELTFTEMIRADALLRGNAATLSLVDTLDPSIPTGLQLFVTKVDVLKNVLAMIREKIQEKDGRFSNLICIDLNFGCPSPEIIDRGGGPALLKRTTRMRELLTTLKKESPLPCGIKIRLGLNRFEKEKKVYLRVIEIANEVGLDWVTVHPKAADATSVEPIDMDALKEIIKVSKVPIVGNGFITDRKSAEHMFHVGCKAVMIARAAVGNPWVFRLSEDKPTKEDYLSALEEYKKLADRYGTKKKFFDYNTKMFTLRMQGDTGYHSPSRILDGP